MVDMYKKPNENIVPNSLINESSPYLLQHAYNPVNWYSWNKESLNKAKEENKPIFLSIGYSSCHWCHVMAHESFEDLEIAKIMNQYYVNIKVDREERPDIDDIYQRVCQLSTGTGGWPLSVFLTPDQKPFYVGTYFPKNSRYGLPGFGTILKDLARLFDEKKDEIDSAVNEFMSAIKNTSYDIKPSSNNLSSNITKSVLDECAINLLTMGDDVYGGFGQSPKFPNVSNLLFLLRYYDLTKNSQFLNFVKFSADKMSEGGIYDHVGGGFARYATDQRWLIPHFEKMLYDNALLVILYCELYQITKEKKYVVLVEHILDYVIREMTDENGSFYSSQDADSEGEEGKYYTWTKDEIAKILDDKITNDIFTEYYGVTTGGNFEGKNILNINTNLKFISNRYNISIEDLETLLSNALVKLLEYRNKRIPPGIDKKILLSWNGLMISAFIKAYKITLNIKYLEIAEKAINFIENNLVVDKSGRLLRVYKDGEAKLNALLDDYSFYICALLDCFEVKSDPQYLTKSIYYTDFMIQHFWDKNEKNFYYTPDYNEELIIRTKSFYDLSIPSGNSVAVNILFRIHFFTQDNSYFEKSENIMQFCLKAATDNPFGFGHLLMTMCFYVKKPIEITLIKYLSNGKNNIETWLNTTYIPNSITSTIIEQKDQNLLDEYLFFKNKMIVDNKENINKEHVFICKNNTCSLPMSSIDELINYFDQIK